jgi:cell division control protein 24
VVSLERHAPRPHPGHTPATPHSYPIVWGTLAAFLILQREKKKRKRKQRIAKTSGHPLHATLATTATDLAHPGSVSVMDLHSAPSGPFRSFSASLASLHSTLPSSTSITRVPSGPMVLISSMNRQASVQEHLYYQCEVLKRKLAKTPEMAPFLAHAFAQAEQCAEQQALALSQQLKYDPSGAPSGAPAAGRAGAPGSRALASSQNFLIHSDNSAASSSTLHLFAPLLPLASNNVFTFTAGVLPATLSADPVTQIWKLFQQGAPLCLLFNTVYPKKECHLPVVPSEDLRVCKKSVYDFLIAVKTFLKYDDDDMFTILNVFSDSTHDLIRIVKTVARVMGAVTVDERGIGEIAISDDRSKVVRELIETERKYVQDLELLLRYKNELSNAELISSEQIHVLFPNLNEIVDFQRRFLVGLECNNKVPNKYQRIGSIFIHAASGPFKAYEPWTIGQMAAIELITREAANLRKLSTLLDPGFELQSYIIKPIQRLCKYPLLLKEFIKMSKGDDAPSAELVVAEQAMKEVANEVNEAQRRAENVGYLHNLLDRVHNWRGFSLRDQGELLHHCVVSVRDLDAEKEYVAYLFERIIFFFVDVSPPAKKEKKTLLQTRKKSQLSLEELVLSSTANLLELIQTAKDKSPLELKGRVYILEIYNISTTNHHGYTLVISWLGKKESGSFLLKYRTEEARNQWEQCLRNLKAIEMNTQIHRKLRDSGSSDDGRPDQRHNSSLSTFSMTRKTLRPDGLRQLSSSGTLNTISDKLLSTTLDNLFLLTSTGGAAPITIRPLFNHVAVSAFTVAPTIYFPELKLKISIKISAETSEDIMINKLKYKDEDGDFVVMDSNDDWVLAVDMLDETSADDRSLTIWVS